MAYAMEMGDSSGAGEVAMETLALSAARPSPMAIWTDRTGFWLRAAHEGKRLSSAEFEKQRDARVGSWRRRVDDPSWQFNGASTAWLSLYSSFVLEPSRADSLEVLRETAVDDGSDCGRRYRRRTRSLLPDAPLPRPRARSRPRRRPRWRWGHAKPRRVTAEKARAEAAKLGCEPVA